MQQGDNKVWYLSRLNLFASLTDDHIDRVAQSLDDQLLPAGTEILQDCRRERLYIIKTGAVCLYTHDHDQRVTLALLGPGRMFGVSSTSGTNRPRIGATTLEPSYICFASLSRILEVCARYPQVMLRMTLALSKQVFQVETWVEHSKGRSPRSRLADLLLELCSDFGEPGPYGQRVKFRLTQADLARMINVSRETTNRVLADFADAGWVTREDGHLVIRDQQALSAVAH
ncbi:MAG: Crp/Fnr family transcriptional regulator [Chloroflexota bacterium]|nr:Crp/Fnr family transcriptional regulator [Chloroflexota bacterium]